MIYRWHGARGSRSTRPTKRLLFMHIYTDLVLKYESFNTLSVWRIWRFWRKERRIVELVVCMCVYHASIKMFGLWSLKTRRWWWYVDRWSYFVLDVEDECICMGSGKPGVCSLMWRVTTCLSLIDLLWSSGQVEFVVFLSRPQRWLASACIRAIIRVCAY